MASNILIGSWSTGLWVTLGSPSNLAVTTISGYATQPNTLGTLNSLIGTCYSGSGYAGTGTFDFDTVPDLTSNELALIGAMYQAGYYTQLAMATMGMDADSLPWTNLKEADSSVSRVNGATIGKEYREMAKDANARLNYLVNAYIVQAQGGLTPRSISFYNPPTWAGEPTPGYGGRLGYW